METSLEIAGLYQRRGAEGGRFIQGGGIPASCCVSSCKAAGAQAANGFEFDEQEQEGDTCVQNQGVKLLVDPMSIQYLGGAEIDYREGLKARNSSFAIRTPPRPAAAGLLSPPESSPRARELGSLESIIQRGNQGLSHLLKVVFPGRIDRLRIIEPDRLGILEHRSPGIVVQVRPGGEARHADVGDDGALGDMCAPTLMPVRSATDGRRRSRCYATCSISTTLP